MFAAARSYGHVALFGIMATPERDLPTLKPGPIIFVFAGHLSAVGALHPVDTELVTGTSILFVTCRLIGAPFVYPLWGMKRIDDERRMRAERLLRHWGLSAWLVIQFISGTREVLALMAGLGDLDYLPVAGLTGAALIWASAFIALGYASGPQRPRAIGLALAGGGLVAILLVLISAGFWPRAASIRCTPGV